jgi:hypothetical protein
MFFGLNQHSKIIQRCTFYLRKALGFVANYARFWFSMAVLLMLISSGVGQYAPLSEGGASSGTSPNNSSQNATVARVGAAGSVIGFSGCTATGTQTITLVNTEKFWMAVYHIDSEGEIHLVSSRPIDADFSLQLNVTDPLPDEIRGLSD